MLNILFIIFLPHYNNLQHTRSRIIRTTCSNMICSSHDYPDKWKVIYYMSTTRYLFLFRRMVVHEGIKKKWYTWCVCQAQFFVTALTVSACKMPRNIWNQLNQRLLILVSVVYAFFNTVILKQSSQRVGQAYGRPHNRTFTIDGLPWCKVAVTPLKRLFVHRFGIERTFIIYRCTAPQRLLSNSLEIKLNL